MRDLATMDPMKYQEIQTELKKIQAENKVNAIASGKHGSATDQINTSTDVVNNDINNRVNANSTDRTYD